MFANRTKRVRCSRPSEQTECFCPLCTLGIGFFVFFTFVLPFFEEKVSHTFAISHLVCDCSRIVWFRLSENEVLRGCELLPNSFCARVGCIAILQKIFLVNDTYIVLMKFCASLVMGPNITYIHYFKHFYYVLDFHIFR